jgi:hypothetical protein
MSEKEFKKEPELFDYTPPDKGFHSEPPAKKVDQEAWDGSTRHLLMLYEILNAADWAQTQQIHRDPQHHAEADGMGINGSAGLVGTHPTRRGVNTLMLSQAVAVPFILDSLPEKWRKILLGLGVAGKAATVKHNERFGLEPVRY